MRVNSSPNSLSSPAMRQSALLLPRARFVHLFIWGLGVALYSQDIQNVKGFEIGDRVAADNSELCGHCFYCRRGEPLLCENVRPTL